LARTPPRNILLLVHPNIGDTVNLTAVARWLKAKWPDSTLVGCTAAVPAPLFASCPYVDEVWIRPEGPVERLKFVARAKAARFDLSVHCQGQNTMLRLVKAAGIPCRIGVAGTKHRDWLDAFVEWQEGEVEQPGTMGRLLTQIGLDCRDMSPCVDVPAAAIAKASALTAGTECVAVMVGASHPAKRWPIERFRSVLERLPPPFVPVFVGGPTERTLVEEVRTPASVDLTGRLTVLETMAVLQRCRLILTNDSGPMHLAAAVGTPVVALFGPTSSTRFAPFGPGHRVLQGRCPCAVRTLDDCQGTCLLAIPVEEVVSEVLQMLSR